MRHNRVLLPSMIKNKIRRSEVHAKLKHEKKLEKQKKLKERSEAEKIALELGEELPSKPIPRTIENTREIDETVFLPDDDEMFAANDVDEFNLILRGEVAPKVLLSTCRFYSKDGYKFISELLSVIPNAFYCRRGSFPLKKVVEYGIKRDFTSVVIVHTNRKKPDALLVIGLPDGPTAHFRLSSLVFRNQIKNYGNPTTHNPDLIFNNFTTTLGSRIGRLLQSLFPQNPDFHGRRVVTFHNQRDFVFFRHHRYIFETKEQKAADSKGKKVKSADREHKEVAKEKTIARLQECGPRFTLKLITLQHGTFDPRVGEYEWVHKAEMDTSRRRFFL